MRQRLSAQNLDDPITRHMRQQVTRLRAEWTVQDALADLREQRLAEQIAYLYVVDAEDRLVGVVPTRKLLMSQPDEPIRSLMLSRVVSIPADATVLIACEFFIMHRFLAFPVVDQAGRIVGAVDVSLFADEVLTLAEKRELDDVFQLIGMHVSQARSPSLRRSFTMRFPWLLANMTGGLGCALLSGFFERRIDAAVVLVLFLFVPVVLALSESVSMQSMTITLQSLHGRRTNWGRFARSIGREFGAACLLGLASGLLVATVAWLWRAPPAVAAGIAGSIWLSMITASLLGLILPSAVRAMRGDPRIAAGPIVLASADVLTLLFYFTVAMWLVGGGQ